MQGTMSRSNAGVAAAIAVAAAGFGLLAGLSPAIAVVTAFGCAFLLVISLNLYVGLLLFTFLIFAAQVPSVEGSGLTIVKFVGLMLALSWLANLLVRPDPRADFIRVHPGASAGIILFLSWALVSQLWAEDSGRALDTTSRLALNAVLFVITFYAIRTREQAIGVVAVFVAGATLDALWGMTFAEASRDPERLGSSISNPNELATILVASLILSVALLAVVPRGSLWKPPLLASAVLCGGSIFLTGSRGGLVALGVALLAFLVVGSRFRGRILLVIGLLVTTGIVWYQAIASDFARQRLADVGSGTGRLDLWDVGLRVFEANPVIGVGVGNFPIVSGRYLLAEPGSVERADYFIGEAKVVHNTYLEFAAELGLIGLALFCFLAGFGALSALRAARQFELGGDDRMQIVSKAVFVALVAMLAADFFGSRQYAKELWLLLGMGPALLAVANRQLEHARPGRLRE